MDLVNTISDNYIRQGGGGGSSVVPPIQQLSCNKKDPTPTPLFFNNADSSR